jgi:hypothetical protein
VIASALAIGSMVRAKPGLTLIAIGAVAAMCGLSWCWGYGVAHAGVGTAVAAEHERVAAEKLTEVTQAHELYRERVRMGDAAAADLRTQLTERERRLADLTRRTAHAPQLIATQACPQPGDVRLSVGAVRLYDAALGGADQQLPSGACGAAGDGAGAGLAGPDAGCEQPSAITAERFQGVAQANANGFGECRVRMRRLVDFLRARQGAEPGGLTTTGGVARDF